VSAISYGTLLQKADELDELCSGQIEPDCGGIAADTLLNFRHPILKRVPTLTHLAFIHWARARARARAGAEEAPPWPEQDYADAEKAMARDARPWLRLNRKFLFWFKAGLHPAMIAFLRLLADMKQPAMNQAVLASGDLTFCHCALPLWR